MRTKWSVCLAANNFLCHDFFCDSVSNDFVIIVECCVFCNFYAICRNYWLTSIALMYILCKIRSSFLSWYNAFIQSCLLRTPHRKTQQIMRPSVSMYTYALGVWLCKFAVKRQLCKIMQILMLSHNQVFCGAYSQHYIIVSLDQMATDAVVTVCLFVYLSVTCSLICVSTHLDEDCHKWNWAGTELSELFISGNKWFFSHRCILMILA